MTAWILFSVVSLAVFSINLFAMLLSTMRKLFPSITATLLALVMMGCNSNPSTPSPKADWYIGKFGGGPFGKNAKQIDLACISPTSCRLSMPSVALGQVAAVPVDPAIANKAIHRTRIAFEANPAFFEEKFKQDVALLRPFLSKKIQFESCVDVGSVRNMFFLCATTDDPNAQHSAVILGATLEPYSEQTCRTKLYCEYYVVPVSRK